MDLRCLGSFARDSLLLLSINSVALTSRGFSLQIELCAPVCRGFLSLRTLDDDSVATLFIQCEWMLCYKLIRSVSHPSLPASLLGFSLSADCRYKFRMEP